MKRMAWKRKFSVTLFMFGYLFIMASLSQANAVSSDDKKISHWVREALQEDPRINPWSLNVSNVEGIVTLTGTVSNLTEKRFADLEAKKIHGVRGVINQLVLVPRYRPDTDIQQDVYRRLINSSIIRLHDLRAKVSDGEVTLSGQVTSWGERRQAELLAREIRGVRGVVNKIDIRYRSSRPDEEIREDVLTSLKRDVYLAGLPIEVFVEDGIVTLKGKVVNSYQKERAEEDAWVSNVDDVKNEIGVDWWKWWEDEKGVRKKYPVPADDELRNTVRDVLYQDLRIEDPYEINVESLSGHVTLRGTVPTYYQKWVADQDAQDVIGVWWVTNKLLVRTYLREDSKIRDDVQFEVDSDSVLNGLNINVSVKDGIVTLSGPVNTFYQMDHAREVASRVWGVRDVITNLTVLSNTYMDVELRNRLRERLASNSLTRPVADQIQVKVEGGKITLTGMVDTWSQYREAARIASLVDGVTAIDNRMSVADYDYSCQDR